MIFIDGSYGEGGGQVLRTSLALSAITDRQYASRTSGPAGASRDCAPSTLTGVRAAAKVCDAKVEGASSIPGADLCPASTSQGGHLYL